MPAGSSFVAICEQFTSEWAAGRQPSIRGYLSTAASQDRVELAKRLILLDVKCRVQYAERPLAEDYAAFGAGGVKLALRALAESSRVNRQSLENTVLVANSESANNPPVAAPGDGSQATREIDHSRSQTDEVAPTSGPASSGGTERSPALDPTVIGDEKTAAVTSSRRVQRIGRYTLLEQIGEGGMGAVYLAEQTTPIKRRVALKLIKAGIDNREIINRFEAERQALAMMEHTNIAKVLDAGTTSHGSPWFVMELVHGIPITNYCNTHKLDVKRRLELFIQTCKAIQHAHQKGIIHRDIKPSNVLVAEHDGEPTVKVIDFGLAKAIRGGERLSEVSMCTQIGQVLGTLQYMSPEQADLTLVDVDARSDIYSLGVLLYELLTGSTPIETQRLKALSLDRLLVAIRDEEAQLPSQRLNNLGPSAADICAQRQTNLRGLKRIVSGDLDWITVKALEKKVVDRFGEVSDLMRDVQAFQSGGVVTSRRSSIAYRSARFWRRYGMFAFRSILVVLLLSAGPMAASKFYLDNKQIMQAVGSLEEAKKAEDNARMKAQEAEHIAAIAQEEVREAQQQAAKVLAEAETRAKLIDLQEKQNQ